MFARMLAESTEESEVRDPWVTQMWNMPAIVVSTTLNGPLDWPDATVVSGDAVDVVARLKEESEVPLRSHGSLSMYRYSGEWFEAGAGAGPSGRYSTANCKTCRRG